MCLFCVTSEDAAAWRGAGGRKKKGEITQRPSSLSLPWISITRTPRLNVQILKGRLERLRQGPLTRNDGGSDKMPPPCRCVPIVFQADLARSLRRGRSQHHDPCVIGDRLILMRQRIRQTADNRRANSMARSLFVRASILFQLTDSPSCVENGFFK